MAENALLEHLESINNKNCPQPIPFKDLSYVKVMHLNGKDNVCRMLYFLEGDFLGDTPPSETVYRSLGNFLARLDLSLQIFSNFTIKSRTWEWDIASLELNTKYIHDIPNVKDRSIVNYFFNNMMQM